MSDDEKILNAIVNLLESNIGFGIEYCNLLVIRQLENLQYAVSHEKFDSETKKFIFDFEEIFDDAKKAATFFLQKRREYELGFDFEVESKSEAS